MNIHNAISMLPHSLIEAQQNAADYMSDSSHSRRVKLAAPFLGAFTLLSALVALDKPTDNAHCNIAVVEDGGNTTDAIYESIRHDFFLNPDGVEGKIYAGQDALNIIGKDGIVQPGQSFEVCLNTDMTEVSSVNVVGSNPQAYPLNVK